MQKWPDISILWEILIISVWLAYTHEQQLGLFNKKNIKMTNNMGLSIDIKDSVLLCVIQWFFTAREIYFIWKVQKNNSPCDYDNISSNFFLLVKVTRKKSFFFLLVKVTRIKKIVFPLSFWQVKTIIIFKWIFFYFSPRRLL